MRITIPLSQHCPVTSLLLINHFFTISEPLPIQKPHDIAAGATFLAIHHAAIITATPPLAHLCFTHDQQFPKLFHHDVVLFPCNRPKISK